MRDQLRVHLAQPQNQGSVGSDPTECLALFVFLASQSRVLKKVSLRGSAQLIFLENGYLAVELRSKKLNKHGAGKTNGFEIDTFVAKLIVDVQCESIFSCQSHSRTN